MMTDPIADMLTRVRNGLQARKKEVEIPASKTKESIAHILKKEGYVGKVQRADLGKKSILKVELRYGAGYKRVITGIKRVSKPGLRIYVGADNIPRVLNGLGIAILSTSKGILSDKECRKQRAGGEVLCYVW